MYSLDGSIFDRVVTRRMRWRLSAFNISPLGLLLAFSLASTGCSCTAIPSLSTSKEIEPKEKEEETQGASEQSPTSNAREPAAAGSDATISTMQRAPSAARELTGREGEESADSESAATEGPTSSADSSSPSDASVPSGTNSRPGKGRPLRDAASTLKAVTGLREKSKQASGRQEYGSAFQFATEAWEAARSHPNDVQLKRIKDEIAVELEALGKQSNSAFGSKASNPLIPLIEK